MRPDRWHTITEIFHNAIARAAPDREAYLAVACQADPSLRAEVDAMIAAHDHGGAFGDSPHHLGLPVDLQQEFAPDFFVSNSFPNVSKHFDETISR